MSMRGRQAGEKSQRKQKTLVRSEGVSRFVENSLLILLLVLSIPSLLCAQQTQQPSRMTLQEAVKTAAGIRLNAQSKISTFTVLTSSTVRWSPKNNLRTAKQTLRTQKPSRTEARIASKAVWSWNPIY